MSRCTAKQYSDQMMCQACGLAWDMNDPDPPLCGQADLGVRVANKVALRRRFERHAAKEGLSLMIHNGEYATPATIAAWRAYQAGYSLPRY